MSHHKWWNIEFEVWTTHNLSEMWSFLLHNVTSFIKIYLQFFLIKKTVSKFYVYVFTEIILVYADQLFVYKQACGTHLNPFNTSFFSCWPWCHHLLYLLNWLYLCLRSYRDELHWLCVVNDLCVNNLNKQRGCCKSPLVIFCNLPKLMALITNAQNMQLCVEWWTSIFSLTIMIPLCYGMDM